MLRDTIIELTQDHCIVRHSLRYFRYSGPVIYKRGTIIEITRIDYKAHKMVLALPKLKTSAKSVQTTAEVCTDYG